MLYFFFPLVLLASTLCCAMENEQPQLHNVKSESIKGSIYIISDSPQSSATSCCCDQQENGTYVVADQDGYPVCAICTTDCVQVGVTAAKENPILNNFPQLLPAGLFKKEGTVMKFFHEDPVTHILTKIKLTYVKQALDQAEAQKENEVQQEQETSSN